MQATALYLTIMISADTKISDSGPLRKPYRTLENYRENSPLSTPEFLPININLSIMKQNISYFNSSFLLFRIRMGFWESSLTTQIFCIQKAIRIPSFKSLSTAWLVPVLAETWQSYSGLPSCLPSYWFTDE